MSQFDESQHRRDSDGKFASKGPAAEAEGVSLQRPSTPEETSAALSAGLVERGVRESAISQSSNGGVTVFDTQSSQRNSPNPFGSRYGTYVGIEPEDDSYEKFRVVSGWQDYEADTNAWDGDEERIDEGLSRDEAVDRMEGYMRSANHASEYGEHFDVYESEPVSDEIKQRWTTEDPWATAQAEEPPF